MTTFSRAKFPACAEIVVAARATFGEDVKVRYVREAGQQIGAQTFKPPIKRNGSMYYALSST